MQRLSKFLRLPTEQRLLVKVSFLLGATQVALRMLPFHTVYRQMARASHPASSGGEQSSSENLTVSASR